MADENQILISFVTKLASQYKVPATPMAVPATAKRLGLSQVINTLLALDPARPFDFLVDGELLRKSLEQHLLDNNLSAESTLEIEYVPAVVPPKHKHSTPHDDWVSSVCSAPALSGIVSGSYDGQIRLWNGEVQCVGGILAHHGGVNSVAMLPASQGSLMLSAGKDHTAKLWALNTAEVGVSEHPFRLVGTYTGHTDSIESISASPDGSRFCSSTWDGQVSIWATGREILDMQAGGSSEAAPAESAAADAAGGKKKRKVGAEDASSKAVPAPGPVAVTQPLSQLVGHIHCVSAVAWPVDRVIYSGGWDHSVRRWDVETGINTETYNGSKAVCSVACHSSSPNVVAFGSSDRVLRLWDSRTRAGEALNIKAYPSHSGWVNCLAWNPELPHLLASGSHDQSVKLWDLRTTVPLGTLTASRDKVLAVGWVGGVEGKSAQQLVSGGADCQLQLYDMDQFASGQL